MALQLSLCVTILSLLFMKVSYSQQQGTTLPVTVSSAVINGTGNGACPPQDAIDAQSTSIKSEIVNILDNTVIPKFSCPCSTPGETWTRIAHLDMTDPNQNCPANTNLNTFGSIRTCGRQSSLIASIIFPSNGILYSGVCGRIIGYQKGSPDGFVSYINDNSLTIEQAYLDGISLTHGPVGSRKHIWSFPIALYDQSTNFVPKENCRCTNVERDWPFITPPFVGEDYFCDTGNPGPTFSQSTFYSDDPLWDGAGCPSTSTCCQFNTPPYFCKALQLSTSNDIEVRLMADQQIVDEDPQVSIIDIYVQEFRPIILN